MKLLLIDNYDSFTYNLWNYLKITGADVDVVLNDDISPQHAGDYDGIVLSPGPGIPSEAGNMPEILSKWAGKRPILGICLGHQAIAETFGGIIYRLPMPYHGVSQEIDLEYSPIFKGVASPTPVGLYHSWAVKVATDVFDVTAVNSENVIMAIYSEKLHLTGVQFHPESVMTRDGLRMIQNWISTVK